MPMKKKVSKKTAKKTSTTKKVALSSKQQTKSTVITKPFNSTQTIKHLAATSGVQKKDVVAIIDTLTDLIRAHLKKNGPGEFTLLGLAKFRLAHKSATKARQGISPFTGEPMTFAAKPARNIVKIRPLKKIKEIVG